jgi:hypothetical protein
LFSDKRTTRYYEIHPTKGQRNEAKMNLELSPIVLSPLYVGGLIT